MDQIIGYLNKYKHTHGHSKHICKRFSGSYECLIMSNIIHKWKLFYMYMLEGNQSAELHDKYEAVYFYSNLYIMHIYSEDSFILCNLLLHITRTY